MPETTTDESVLGAASRRSRLRRDSSSPSTSTARSPRSPTTRRRSVRCPARGRRGPDAAPRKDTEVVWSPAGRSASLAAVTHAPEGMALVGSHGVEWRVDGHDEAALSTTRTARVARVGAALDEVGAGSPGSSSSTSRPATVCTRAG